MRVKLYSLIVFLRSLSTGLLVPVLSLLLIDKGASLSNISIIMGIYSLTVVVLELPTGILADVIGRKKIFCLSLIVALFGYSVILIGQGMIFLCIGIIFYGTSRALSSGSFDALFIDSYIETFGKDKLHKITVRLSVLDSLGLSLGALTGGVLPKFSQSLIVDIGTFDLNLVAEILLIIIVLLLSVVFISENSKSDIKKNISLKNHIKDSSLIVIKNRTIKCIFISAFATGFFLLTIETYWQPHFTSLLPDNSMYWLLGIISFLYFASSIFGSIISEKIIERYNLDFKKMYLILRTMLVSSLIVAALQLNAYSFIVFYTLIYLFLGMSNIPENVILNSEIPGNIRASVLSVNSLVLQMGGLTGSLINSFIINYISIPVLWMIAAGVIFITILIISKNFIFDRHREVQNRYE
ncbi:MFS transporter [Sedimentibacter saalensis]|uniref:Putative MFS family arabinose efflux permease n=1 Tax=Sedimentibacter saalensis TaxID=130788 RepID=A0A562JC16_9FIRM|nr:MFS transporter [Sedimentibacter saalensis]TWH80762.1 putative MFS family arabinose efflux permease [Sedimentibacter saalensis]